MNLECSEAGESLMPYSFVLPQWVLSWLCLSVHSLVATTGGWVSLEGRAGGQVRMEALSKGGW